MKERPLVKSLAPAGPADAALGVLSHFRVEFYDCLYSRADALFELTDAVLCADGPVKTLVELSLAVEHRRGHGALYAALDRGWPEPTRLRRALAGLPLPKAADGRIVLAVGPEARQAEGFPGWRAASGHGVCACRSSSSGSVSRCAAGCGSASRPGGPPRHPCG